jgi:HAD superfamily hydrolase (TIGR01662 family)
MTDRRFDAVLFDLGYTLIYFDCETDNINERMNAAMFDDLRSSGVKIERDSFLAQFNHRLQAYESERDTEFIEHTTAFILNEVFREYGLAQPQKEVIKSALKARYSVSQACWKLVDHAPAVLENLRSKVYRLGVITNAGDEDDVRTLIDNARLRPYFDLIVSSAGMGIRKPNPRIFLQVLSQLGVEPERAVMVGDTLGADILGAHNAGMFAIWVTRWANKAANRDHLDTIQPDAVIGSIRELPGLLDRLS